MRTSSPRILILSLALVATLTTHAERRCNPGESCSAFVHPDSLPAIQVQETMVWCWVASAQAIFRYYGYEVDQQTIVTETLGGSVVTTANAAMMISMLNRDYVDRSGRRFRVQTRAIYDGFSWLSANPGFLARIGARPLDNAGIRDALAADRPVLMGTMNHAMVLVKMGYDENPWGVQPRDGWVLDPAPAGPGYATGLRPLAPYEMTAFFAADVIVTPLGNGRDAPTPPPPPPAPRLPTYCCTPWGRLGPYPNPDPLTGQAVYEGNSCYGTLPNGMPATGRACR